jgi:hypothetical protein
MGIKFLVAAALAASAWPALAASSIIITPRLSPSDPLAVNACTSINRGNTNQLCTGNGQFIGYDFGSTAELMVRHSHAGATDHGILFQSGFGSYLPGFFVFTAQATRGVITFTPLAGHEVRLIGFDARRGTATFNDGDFKLFNAANQEIWATTTGLLAATSFSNFAVNSGWASDSLRFTYGALSSGATIVSNFALEVRAIPTNGAVPEPASWAMLIAGFGLVGAASRRRRRKSVAA